MIPKYFDIHTHLHFGAFKNDSREAVERALDEGIWMIQVGTQKDTSAEAIRLAEGYPEGVYATVGLHPIHTGKSFHDKNEVGGEGKAPAFEGEVFDYEYYKKLALHPKVVGIGECGLDYFRLSEETKKKQYDAFEKQIALAQEVGKPLMLHIRNAYDDALAILKKNPGAKGNVHFFAGSWEVARQFLDIGFTLSFTGVVTFTRDYDDVIKNTPLDMIMSETDSPYVAPVPHRGKRNESLYVAEVVKRIAEVRGEDVEMVRAALAQNARRVFLQR